MAYPHLARGRLKVSGAMNKLEAKYALVLKAKMLIGEVSWFAFETIKLRLADSTFYTPDFFVMLPDGELQCHETKGFMRDDAAVKIKVAAEIYPFAFFLCMYDRNAGWSIRRIGRAPGESPTPTP